MPETMHRDFRYQHRFSLFFFCMKHFFFIIGLNDIVNNAINSTRHIRSASLCYEKLLKGAYARIHEKYSEKSRRISSLMRQLSQEEKKNNQDVDFMAGLFGEVMGEIMACREDEWQESLRTMGFFLGKFIYLMDAYEDVEEDMEKGRYNPLIRKFSDPDFEEEMKTILTMMMAGCCKEFEKLPILENAEILRNILYSGVWYRYEMVSQKRRKGN